MQTCSRRARTRALQVGSTPYVDAHWQLLDKNNLRLAATAWTTTPSEGSRIRDVPSADSEPVYRPYVEETCSAAAPFRCGRFYGLLHPNALISVPSQGVASIRTPYLKRFVGVDTRASFNTECNAPPSVVLQRRSKCPYLAGSKLLG
jgi:hypothetical protein